MHDRIRRANLEALEDARRGRFAAQDLIHDALTSGNQILVLECRVSRMVALVNVGRVTEAKSLMSLVRKSLESGVELDTFWSWHLETTSAVIALDHARYRHSWTHFGDALRLARVLQDPALIAESRVHLAHLAARIGLLGDALVELDDVLANDGIAFHTRICAHLLLGMIYGEQGDLERAEHHSGSANDLVSDSPDFYGSRTLTAIAGLLLDSGESDWARRNLRRLETFAALAESDYVRLEFDLLHAKLLYRLGDSARALDVLNAVVKTAPAGYSVRSEALVVLSTILVEGERYQEALDTSARALAEAAPPARRSQLLELRAQAFEHLGHWRSAVECYDEAVASTASQSLDILVIYERHHEEVTAAALQKRNERLEARNAELVLLGMDHQAIVNAIGNSLQSPLTALQLNLELLGLDLSEQNVLQRSEACRRVAARLSRIAHQLTLAGELESGTIVPEGTWLPTRDLFEKLVWAATQACSTRDLKLHVRTGSIEDDEEAYVDEDRAVQIMGALFDGIADFAPSDSVVDLLVSNSGGTNVAVDILAPNLNLDPELFETFHARAAELTLGPLDPESFPDLELYLVARLCEILGCELRVNPRGSWGTQLRLLMPTMRRVAVA